MRKNFSVFAIMNALKPIDLTHLIRKKQASFNGRAAQDPALFF